MNFLEAVWYLRENGATVRPTGVYSGDIRMYLFRDEQEYAPPMLLSPKAVVSLAFFLNSEAKFDRQSTNPGAF